MTRRWLALVALAGAAWAAWVARIPLEGIPHVQDEAAYTWQAELLATLRLSAPAPDLPVPRLFVLVDGDRFIGTFPPGWPALLALGVLLGVPWLVNPLLHGLLVYRGGILGGRLGGDSASLPTAALLALSPQAWLLGASRMSHTLVALCAVVAADAALSWRERGRTRDAAVSGAAVAVALCARPLCGVVLGAFVAAGMLARRERGIVVGGALAAAGAGGLLLVNWHGTGSAWTFPVDVMFDKLAEGSGRAAGCNALGFGIERGCDPGRPAGHDLGSALANTGANLSSWARLLLGHPALLALPLLSLHAAPRVLGSALALAAATITAYALYWYEGTAYGAGFYQLAVPGILVATGIGVARLPAVARTCVLGAALVVNAIQAPALVSELRGYWGVDARVYDLAASWASGPAIVLVDEGADRSWSGPRTGPAQPIAVRGSWLYAGVNGPFPGALVFVPANLGSLDAARRDGRRTWALRLGPSPGSFELFPPDRVQRGPEAR
jgi:hypothetical protein